MKTIIFTGGGTAGHVMPNLALMDRLDKNQWRIHYIGTEEGIDVDLAVEERRCGDLWLICSDGLHGLVKDSQMEAILSVNTAEAAAKLLMDAALAAGGRDNISVVLVPDGEVAR